MRKILLLSLLATAQCGLLAKEEESKKQPLATESLSDEEAFLVRRIAEFWKDGDYHIVKEQIQDFLAQYPHSTSGDLLRGLLGDLYLQEKQYEKALGLYEVIADKDIKEKTLLNKWQCYYELNQFSSLSADIVPFLSKQPETFKERMDEFNFLAAQSFFHQAFQTDQAHLKTEMLKLAEPFFEKLFKTPYEDAALFSLGEIYRYLSQPEKASAIYQKLADRYPSDQEDLLFQAASMQALYNKKEAIDSFKAIAAKKGKYSTEALFNQMILHFQTGEFEKTIDLKEDLISSLDDSHKALFHYMLGKSHFNLKQYQEAIPHLQNYFEYPSDDPALKKNSYLLLMSSCTHVKNEALFERVLNEFSLNYKNDDQLPKAIFAFALICKETGNYPKMELHFKELMETYPKFDQRETLLFEYALYCHERQKWNECYSIIKSYLQEYPSSKKEADARKLLISSNLQKIQSATDEAETNIFLASLEENLEATIQKSSLFQPSEKDQYRFLYGKVLFNLKKYDQCFKAIDSLEKSLEADSMAELYYLRAQVSLHTHANSPEVFYESMEKAIKLNPELANNPSIHLQLYNAFINNYKKNHTEVLLDKAAHHLYNAFVKGYDQINLENLLWLANYHYGKAEKIESFNPEKEHFRVALSLYNKILLKDGYVRLIDVTQEHLYLEQEILKFGQLLGHNQDATRKVAIFKQLIELQNLHSQWQWQLKDHILVELAKTYDSLSDHEKALETYSFLKHSKDPFFSEIAKFHVAKLKFSFLESDEKTETYPGMVSILNDLKELQIRKNPFSEPIHLEAGLEYAAIRSQIAESEKETERYVFFLTRLKEDFQSTVDPLAIDYREKLKELPEKKSLFEDYMRFIDAECLRAKAQVQHQSKNHSAASELNKEALAIYQQIQQKPSHREYLNKRVQNSLGKITALERK